MKKPPTAHRVISERFIEDVCSRLAENKQVRRTLPAGGRLHIDRQLPFLCVYRRPADRSDAGTEQLVSAEASFLIAPGGSAFHKGLSQLVRRIAETLGGRFGGCLIVEIWSARNSIVPEDTHQDDEMPLEGKPSFRIAVRGVDDPRAALDTLEKALRRIRVRKQGAQVQVGPRADARPPGMRPLLPIADAKRLGCDTVGLEVRPVYRDPDTSEVFPARLRGLRRGLSLALKQAFFRFAQTHTTARPKHFLSLGRRAMVKAVWEVDRRIADIGESFDFLLQATPVNTSGAWKEFQRSLFEKEPVFHYRPLAVEPSLLKRHLYEIPIEKIEDPTLAHLFRQKQDELDRKITMLSDVGSSRFFHGSMQVYGKVEPSLLELARQLLDSIPPRSRDTSVGRQLRAWQFAERARAEIEIYRKEYPEFRATVTVRDDMYWGLLVSGGELLIGRQTVIPAGRVEPLLHHEVGTHLITYYNGHAQPFRQLYCGLAGYDALQEGLAVLAEYLTGGMSRPRMRLLAGRVVASQMVADGASFVDTFRVLHQEHGLPRRVAYTITMRVYRGGGLTKDAVYLRGLVEILDYLGDGGELEPLFVGKIAADHIPLVRELQIRHILRPPPLKPRYMDNPAVCAKLLRLRKGLTVTQLLKVEKR